MATNVASSSPQASFRRLLPAPDRPQLAGLSSSSAREWYESRRRVPELFDFLVRLEAENLEKPYIGITSDGHVIPDLFDYTVDEGAPVAAMCEATNAMLSILSVQQENDTVFPSVLDDNIRLWSNPEVYVNPGGLRLDECSPDIQTAVHNILRSSMSLEGYQKVHGCCIVNKFLGELVGGSRVLNEHSYNFRLFGRPSLTQPWGYTFFGHHLCLAVVVAGGRMVIGPTFMGAEPNIIDEGPHTGLQLFTTEREVALQLLRSLPPALQAKAILSHSVLPQDLPEHRWVPYDERHLAGARHDNRVIPYEGCPASSFDADQKELLVRIFVGFNLYYPEQVLSHKVQMFRNHLHMTHFAWIGGHGDDDVYYFRIYSPVSLMEFDFHCGVYLTNDTPDKCHIHTINRIPNRGDYGRALVEQVQKNATVSGQGLGLKST
ncbi:hypothetical protein FPOAC2_14200 [Fusarium poae]|uniref:uncharacterized protein n=1 Tax=Fusarium poae TaxID=36050 RepID=UPI001D037A09|nr:uncharacterized protein FPOAC1_013975 [Fusarium poae]KAG8664268.1 hypothetical protein FPOAC1_013975 [Fusarium poae]